MKMKLFCFLAIVLSGALMFLLGPQPSDAFVSGGCSEGECSDCHSLALDESKELLGDLVKEVHNVDFSEVPGLFVIDVSGNTGKRGLVYLDFSKKYIIAGNFMRLADRKSVSGEEMLRLRRIDLTTIPLDDSLIVGDPKAPKKIILFTDPQCPYCKKLHPELAKVVDADPEIVFFIKLMPIVSLHPDSYRISKTIMCEGSLKRLEDSFADRKIPDPSCDSDAVDRTLKLAQSLGIGSTPTLILPDGRVVPGYRPAEDIVKLVNKN